MTIIDIIYALGNNVAEKVEEKKKSFYISTVEMRVMLIDIRPSKYFSYS